MAIGNGEFTEMKPFWTLAFNFSLCVESYEHLGIQPGTVILLSAVLYF